METLNRYIVVDSEVLPDVFLKVVEAKEILAKGIAKSSSDACKTVGISRGTYYKYKDHIFPYREELSHETVTFQFVLEDEPGILSALLTRFYDWGANIVTVNQNIPNDAVAVVSVSVRMPGTEKREEILTQLRQMRGVVEGKIL